MALEFALSTFSLFFAAAVDLVRVWGMEETAARKKKDNLLGEAERERIKDRQNKDE